MNVNQITKIKTSKKNYVLFINGNEYPIDEYYYECILPYVGKVFEVSEMLELIAFSNANEIIKKQYKHIFNNSISTYELKEKLSKSNVSNDHINLIVNRLKQEQHLKEIDFINHYIEIYQYKKGKKTFKSFLESKHISQRQIELAIDRFVENEEYAFEYASKYINSKVSSNAMLKQKVLASLINKGFSKETINKVLDKLEFEKEDENLEKEVKKYLKKYPDDEYKVISKLASKGYNVSKIKNMIRKEAFSIEN